jgi:hypothetical protein
MKVTFTDKAANKNIPKVVRGFFKKSTDRQKTARKNAYLSSASAPSSSASGSASSALALQTQKNNEPRSYFPADQSPPDNVDVPTTIVMVGNVVEGRDNVKRELERLLSTIEPHHIFGSHLFFKYLDLDKFIACELDGSKEQPCEINDFTKEIIRRSTSSRTDSKRKSKGKTESDPNTSNSTISSLNSRNSLARASKSKVDYSKFYEDDDSESDLYSDCFDDEGEDEDENYDEDGDSDDISPAELLASVRSKQRRRLQIAKDREQRRKRKERLLGAKDCREPRIRKV